jgi:hypothetical protein
MNDKKCSNQLQKIDSLLTLKSKNNGQLLNTIKNANPHKKF